MADPSAPPVMLRPVVPARVIDAIRRGERDFDGIVAGVVADDDAVAVGIGEDERHILAGRLGAGHAVDRGVVGGVRGDRDA